MQYLFALLTQLFTKAWVFLVITFMAGGGVAVYYFSLTNPGSTPSPTSLPVIAPIGPVTTTGHSSPLPVLPEANAGLVLIPVVAAMLLLSSRRFLPAKAGAICVDQRTVAGPGPQKSPGNRSDPLIAG
jgi:hypothetical protein